MSEQTEIKIDLTEGFQNLSKAPIVEAAIDVRARAEAPWQEGPVSQQLKGQLPDYPKVVSQKEIQQQFRLAVGEPLEGVTHDLGWKGLQLQSVDGRHVAQRSSQAATRRPPWSAPTLGPKFFTYGSHAATEFTEGP